MQQTAEERAEARAHEVESLDSRSDDEMVLSILNRIEKNQKLEFERLFTLVEKAVTRIEQLEKHLYSLPKEGATHKETLMNHPTMDAADKTKEETLSVVEKTPDSEEKMETNQTATIEDRTSTPHVQVAEKGQEEKVEIPNSSGSAQQPRSMMDNEENLQPSSSSSSPVNPNVGHHVPSSTKNFHSAHDEFDDDEVSIMSKPVFDSRPDTTLISPSAYYKSLPKPIQQNFPKPPQATLSASTPNAATTAPSKALPAEGSAGSPVKAATLYSGAFVSEEASMADQSTVDTPRPGPGIPVFNPPQLLVPGKTGIELDRRLSVGDQHPPPLPTFGRPTAAHRVMKPIEVPRHMPPLMEDNASSKSDSEMSQPAQQSLPKEQELQQQNQQTQLEHTQVPAQFPVHKREVRVPIQEEKVDEGTVYYEDDYIRHAPPVLDIKVEQGSSVVPLSEQITDATFFLNPSTSGLPPPSGRRAESISDKEASKPSIAQPLRPKREVFVTDRWLTTIHKEKGKYTGTIDAVTQQPNGNGRMEYEDKTIYDGHWNQGKWHGNGVAQFPEGDTYSGNFENDDRHGIGTYVYRDGREYAGGYDHGKRSGQGKFTWRDGSSYEGGFLNGYRDGKGTYKFPNNGGSYTGEWLKGSYHGYGVLIRPNGRRYEGQFQEGRAHGEGIETLADGTIFHSGIWIEDHPVR